MNKKYTRKPRRTKYDIDKALPTFYKMIGLSEDYGLDMNVKNLVRSYFEHVGEDDFNYGDYAIKPDNFSRFSPRQLAIQVCKDWSNDIFKTKREMLEALSTAVETVNTSLEENANYAGSLILRDMKEYVTTIIAWVSTEASLTTLYNDKNNIGNLAITLAGGKIEAKEELKELIREIGSIILGEELTYTFKNAMRNLESMQNSNDVLMNMESELALVKTEHYGMGGIDEFDMIIDFNDENIEEILDAAEEKMRSSKPYATGMYGVNEMTGGGYRAGEYVSIGALSHQYKSGMTTSSAVGVATCNDWRTEFADEIPTKGIPTMVLCSMEDKLDNFYRNAYEILIASDMKQYMTYTIAFATEDRLKIPFKLVVKDVNAILSRNGLRFVAIKVDPTVWTFDGLHSKLDSLIAGGMNIKCVLYDYLDKFSDNGMGDNGVTGEAKRMKVRKSRNWGLNRGILIINPWQLNGDVGNMRSSGATPEEFLRFVAQASLYMGNKTLNTDMDLELFTTVFLDKSIEEGMKFLGVTRGKHRGFGDVSDKKKFIYYRFKDGLKPGLDVLIGKKHHKNSVEEFREGVTEEDIMVF